MQGVMHLHTNIKSTNVSGKHTTVTVTEWIPPRGVQLSSPETHSWAENIAGKLEVRCKTRLHLPAPTVTSQVDMSGKSGGEEKGCSGGGGLIYLYL